MRAGGGHAKGASYERGICKLLSLWVSRGTAEDYFWRSSMSGGRATIALRRGVSIRQHGDICAVAPEGNILTGRFFIECKHVRSLDLESFLLFNRGVLARFWEKAAAEARNHDREPLIIARQNRCPDLVIAQPWAFKVLARGLSGMSLRAKLKSRSCEVRFLEDVLKAKFALE